jgi:hypothetical protein
MKTYCKLLFGKSEGEEAMNGTKEYGLMLNCPQKVVLGLDRTIQDRVQLNESADTNFRWH